MKIRHVGGALAEVDEDLGRHLLALSPGTWADANKRPARRAPARRSDPAPAPVEAPATE